MRTRIIAAAHFGIALAMALAAVNAFAETSDVSDASDTEKPFIVKIHADWCGTCTRMNSTFDELDAKLGSKTRIVVLDVTDRDALGRSTQEADRLGIRGFFDRYKGKTGTVGVLNGATREPVKVMKGETDISAYESAVALATEG